MSALAVIEDLDIFEDLLLGLVPGLKFLNP